MTQDLSSKSQGIVGNTAEAQASVEEHRGKVDATEKQNKSYGQILKSTALIGGSSIINILIGMIRTKCVAVLLGPSGVGLYGLYGSIVDLTQSVVGMGINSSGVRQIAEAVGTEDSIRIAKTAQVLQRTSIFLGLLGAVFLFGFSPQLSQLTFGDKQQESGVALLSLVVFFNLLSAGQAALLQGMRRISDLAKLSILGSILGTLATIPIVYFFHEDGVVVSLVICALIGFVSSSWYRRKIKTSTIKLLISELGQEQMALLKLGFAFMSSGLMMTGAAYVVRLFIVRIEGVDAAGLYQSAWSLGGMYIGFILQAMGTDFYPRLTAIITNKIASNRIVNEQAHISMLLAGPGVVATLTFAPIVIAVFYSAKFDGAIELLRWLCLGMTLRVISWPMGFIIVAKNAQKLFFFSELAWTIVYVGLAWLCISIYKVNGVGIAFFVSYLFHVVMIYLIVRQLTGFRWSLENIQTSILFLTLIGIVFTSYYVLPTLLAIGLGLLVTLFCSGYSLRILVKFVPPDQLPRPLLRLFTWLRITELGTRQDQVGSNISGFNIKSINWIIGLFFVIGIIYAYFCYYDEPDWFYNAWDSLRSAVALSMSKIKSHF